MAVLNIYCDISEILLDIDHIGTYISFNRRTKFCITTLYVAYDCKYY
jgi:hypothetical protein